jgi:hypothetical protein
MRGCVTARTTVLLVSCIAVVIISSSSWSTMYPTLAQAFSLAPHSSTTTRHATTRQRRNEIGNLLQLMLALDPDNNNNERSDTNRCGSEGGTVNDTRRRVFQQQLLFAAATAATTGFLVGGGAGRSFVAHAAPPMAVIAEELGYFPVRNKAGDLVYIPKRVSRPSSEQAVRLAEKLRQEGVAVFTAYWCPHCARQGELFGRQAWEEQIRRVECSPAGYGANPSLCLAKNVDGYPTWIFPKTATRAEPLVISGERPLLELAQAVGMRDFNPKLETNLPPMPGSAACKQK